jgi:membrane protease YdiL (CAAX protease family)
MFAVLLLLCVPEVVFFLLGLSLSPSLEEKANAVGVFATIVVWWLWIVAGTTRRAGFRTPAPKVGAVLKLSSQVALAGLLASLVWVLVDHVLGLPPLGLRAPSALGTGGRALGSLAFDVFLVALLAPVAEEMVFRGALFRKWRLKWGPGKAALVTSVLFALLHPSPVTAGLFALSMAVLYTTTRTLWAPVVAHVINNLLPTLFQHLLPLAALEVAADRRVQVAFLVPGLFGTWWLVRFLRRGWHTLGDPVHGVLAPAEPRLVPNVSAA